MQNVANMRDLCCQFLDPEKCVSTPDLSSELASCMPFDARFPCLSLETLDFSQPMAMIVGDQSMTL
ncbi:hypothetical protein, partial [Bacillus cereus]|uniref:hypothetical protein n=1 Tax=Bacillus cereus TaxID=1396 RepID=UPI0034D46078